MSGRALTTLVVAFLSASARADDIGSSAKDAGVEAFTEGTRLLTAGKDARPAFQKALKHFREASSGKLSSAGACRNLGNAAYLASDLPYAIAAYRAGLILEAQQPGLRANLDDARTQVQHLPGQRGRAEADSWPTWLPRWRAGTLLGVGAVVYALGWLAATAWWRRRRVWLLGTALAGLAMSVGAGYGWWLHARQAQLDRDMPPIVIRNESAFLTGNGPNYPRHADLPLLHRGMEARLLSERGGWLQIRFASGETGWIDGADVWLISLTDDERPAVSVEAGRKSAD